MAVSLTEILHGDTRRLFLRWRALGAAGVLGFLGIVFLAVAFDLWLAAHVGHPAAAAATAGLLFVGALAVVGAVSLMMVGKPPTPSPGRDPDTTSVAEMTATLIDLSRKLEGEMGAHLKPLAIAAVVAGCVVGYSPTLRRKLGELLGEPTPPPR